jgi:hypothetical protein
MKKSYFPAGWFLFVILSVLFVSGCDLDTDDSSGSRDFFDVDDLVSDVMDAAPVLTNALVSRGTFAAGSLDTNKPLSNVYTAYKDYDPSVSTMDQGVDGSNIYVSIHQTLTILEGLAETGDDPSFASATVVAPTFSLVEGGGISYEMGGLTLDNWEGTSGIGYQTSWAANSTDSVIETLIASNISGDSGGPDGASSESGNITYLKHNSTDGSVLLDLNYVVEYTTGEIYAPRVWLSGNMNTHSFTIRGGGYGYQPSSDLDYYSVYEGAGCNDTGKYMLFHTHQYIFTSGTYDSSPDGIIGAVTPASGSGWYKIAAKAGESDLEALTGYDTLAELVAAEGDPEGYADLVSPLESFGFDEMVHSFSDFTNSNVLSLP